MHSKYHLLTMHVFDAFLFIPELLFFNGNLFLLEVVFLFEKPLSPLTDLRHTLLIHLSLKGLCFVIFV